MDDEFSFIRLLTHCVIFNESTKKMTVSSIERESESERESH